MAKKTRIAINGFGRIGKMAFKVAMEHHADHLEIVAINDPGPVEVAVQGLKYDSVYPPFPFDIDHDDSHLIIDGVKIPKYSELEPNKLPWGDMDIDVVLECTGVFRDKEGAEKHLKAGAKAVIISAPAKGKDPVGTYVMGVNHDDHDVAKEQVISNASCTTNCIAPVMHVIEKEFGVEKAMLSTIHGYTADQRLVDGTHKDPRRARAAAINIIPTSTGAAKATAEAIPAMEGIFDGMAFRVPVPVGSVSDITAVLKKDVTVEDINAALEKAANGSLKNILGVTRDPIVSSDVVGNRLSAIVDLAFTTVVGGNLVKIVAWYDNEYGYSNRLIEQAVQVGKDF